MNEAHASTEGVGFVFLAIPLITGAEAMVVAAEDPERQYVGMIEAGENKITKQAFY